MNKTRTFLAAIAASTLIVPLVSPPVSAAPTIPAPVTAGATGALNTGQAALSSSSNRALQVTGITLGNLSKGVQAAAKSGLAAGAVTFGFDELTSLLFPKPSTSQLISNLEAQDKSGFNTIQSDLLALQNELSQVGSSVQTSSAFGASATCEAVLGTADAKVTVIQNTLTNYSQVFDPTWWNQNLANNAPQAAQKAVFNKVFPNAGDYTNYKNAVKDLADLLVRNGGSVSNGLVSACADDAASSVIAANAVSNGQIAPIGVLENAYFSQMQDLTSYYTTIVNVGQVVAATMGQIQAGSQVKSTLTPVPCGETPGSNEAMDAKTCQDLAGDVRSVQGNVRDAWLLTGASWSQVTGGAIQTDLSATPSSSTFTNGANAWVTDIAQYGAADGLDAKPGKALDSTKTGSGPASGSSQLSVGTWAGIPFTSATSADWNNLLQNQQMKLPSGADPGGDNIKECLPTVGSASSTDCSRDNTTGQLMASAGLRNGGKPVDSDLIIYTGETDSWDASNGAWAFGIPYKWDGAKFPSGGRVVNNSKYTSNEVPALTVNSFLDTNFTPNQSTSVVIHDPADITGKITTSSIFPFSNYSQQGLTGGTYVTNWPLSSVMPTSGYAYSQVACQDDGGNSNWYENVSFAQSSWVNNRFVSPLNCGGYNYSTNGANTSALTLTNNPDFYKAPELQLMGVDKAQNAIQIGNLDISSGVYVCTSGVKAILDNTTGGSKYLDSCNQPWVSTPGYANDGSGAANKQYLWPVVDIPASVPVLGTDSSWVGFSQGTDGNLGLPAVDRTLFQQFLAQQTGQQFGDVGAYVVAGIADGAGKGTDAAQILIINEAGSSQQVSMRMVVDNASKLSAPVDVSSQAMLPSLKDLVCAPDGQDAFECSMTVPAGGSVLALPMTATGPKDQFGNATAQVAVVADAGTYVSPATGDAMPAAFGGTFVVSSAPSAFSQAVKVVTGDKDAGVVHSLRAVTIDTPAGQVGKVQESTGKKAGDFGVKLSAQYEPGTADSSPDYDVVFLLEGSLPDGTTTRGYVGSPSAEVFLPKDGKWTLKLTPQAISLKDVSAGVNGKVINTKKFGSQLEALAFYGPVVEFNTQGIRKANLRADSAATCTWRQYSNGLTGETAPLPCVVKPDPKYAGTNTYVAFNPTISGSGQVDIVVTPGGSQSIKYVYYLEWVKSPSPPAQPLSGGSDSVTVGVGPEAAPEPTHVTVDNTSDGKVLVKWRPVSAVPPVSSYQLLAYPPDGSTPERFVIPASATEYSFRPNALGVWQLSLSAENELGLGEALTGSVTVTSAVPAAPTDVDVTISPTGVVSAAWTAAVAQPKVSSYHVGLYSPSGERVFGDVVPVSSRSGVGTIRLPEFYGLGKDAQPGEWTFVVFAQNADGAGASARSSILLTQNAISRMERLVSEGRFLEGALAATLIGVDRAECAAGLIDGDLLTGQCVGGVFIPASGLVDVFNDPGSSVSALSCAGDAAGKAIDNCNPVSGAVIAGAARLLITQEFASKPEGSPIAVWFGSKKLWSSDGPVKNGVSVQAAVPMPSGSYVVNVVTEDTADVGRGVVTVVQATAGEVAGPGAQVASSVSVISCTGPGAPGPGCPTVTGSVTDGVASLIIVNGDQRAFSMNISDPSSGAVVWGTQGKAVAAGQSVAVSLAGVPAGTSRYLLLTDKYRVTFEVTG